MKRTHLTKRMLSIALSVIMVVTMIPMGAFVAEAKTQWTAVASSDFSQATLGSGTVCTSSDVPKNNTPDLSHRYNMSVTAPAYITGTSTINWTARYWNDNGAPTKETDSVHIYDGYMYMSGYGDNSGIPIKGASRFKIDFGFRFKSDSMPDDVANDNAYCFMKVGAYGNFGNFYTSDNFGDSNDGLYGYTTFTQAAYGKTFSYDHTLSTGSDAKKIAPGNSLISYGTSYHYIVEYTGTHLKAYVTNNTGAILFTLLDTTDSTALSEVARGLPVANYFKIGASGEKYYTRSLEYQNIVFYTGSSVADASTAGQPSNASDKYVMAYFTGNYNLENESLRYAVSEDGINFHALNKGLPVADIDIPESGEGLTVYPTGASMTGAYSTGHIRDPYILRKQDGSGFYILATDLDTYTNGFSLNAKILVWDVEHLEDVTNTQPWAVDVCSLIGSYTRRAWAPEAFYDSAKGKYFLHFSIKCDGIDEDGNGNTDDTYLYGIYTSDFQSFDGSPKRLINTGACNIDASINYNSSDDLYYMWYKNESNSKLNYATATNADGPYVNQGTFDYSLGVEGPEIFRNLANDGWIFLCDAYGEAADPATSKQGIFQAFTSSTINGFDPNSPVSTNIAYLYARHAGVARITNAEYNALIAAYGGEVADVAGGSKVSYYFSGNTSHTGTGWLGSVKDPAEQIFKVAHDDQTGSYSTSMGVLSLTNTSVFMQDNNLRSILKSDAYTINFKCKITDAAKLSTNLPIAAVGNINKDYIRLEADGDFYVNGTTVASGFTPVANTEYDISISYNGAIASLFVDGVYKTGLVLDDSVVDPSGAQCYLALGWTDTCGETDRISADYTDLTIVNTALETRNKDEEAISSYITNAATDDVIEDMEKVSQSTGSIYFNTSAVSAGNYSNILYAGRPTSFDYYDGTTYKRHDTKVGYKGGTTTKRVQMRVSYPSVTAFYDGETNIVIPVVMGICQEGGGNNTYPNYAYLDESAFYSPGYWFGYDDGSGNAKNNDGTVLWPSTVTNSLGYKNSSDNIVYHNTTNFSNNTERIFKNTLVYKGTPSSTLTEFGTVTWRFGANTNSESSNNESSSKYNSYDDSYYVPIRIIDVTDLNDIIDDLQDGNVTEYNNIVSNNNYYTPASTKDFLAAIKQVADVDINSYFSMSTTSEDGTNNYTDAVTAIDDAVSAYNTAKANLTRQYKVTYQRDVAGTENDGEIDHYYLATGTSSSTVSDLAPSLTSINDAHYHDSTYHYTYTWTGAGFANVSADATYATQVASSEAHTPTVSQGYVAAAGDVNGYTDYNCSVCDNNNLSDRVWDSHTTDWTAYNTKANSTASILADPTYASTYTTSSKATFESEVAAAKSGVTSNDETKSASYITTRTTALANAERKLNHVADFSTLDTNVNTSASAKSSGTTYTYSTFVPFANAYNAANDIKTNTSGNYVRANTPMYATDGSGYVTEALSDEQDAITSAANTLATTYGALATADTTENYATFDYANTVASSVDSEKYKNSAFTTFTNAKTTAYNAAYHTLADATEANNYNTLAGTSLSAGDKVKDSAHVDTQTNDLMTAITTLNTSGVKQLWVTLTVEDDTTGTQIGDTVRTNVNYGELYTATLPAAASGKNVDKWSISYYSYNDNHEGETVVSSSKLSGVQNTFTRAVNNNMAIVAAVSDSVGAADTKKIVVNDMYKNVTDIFYVASNTSIPSSADVLGEKKLTIGSHEVSVKDVPFYSFDKWTLSSDDANNVYTYTPVYTTSKKCSFSFIGATTSSKNVDFDRRVDIVYDSSIETAVKTTAGVSNAEFVAWAVQTTSGKYQIASYNSNYTFYSVVDENFVPIMNIGTSENPTYVAVTSSNGDVSSELTADNIDSSIPTIDATNFTPNQLLKYKLKNKCPFIHVQEVKVQGSRARAYCRVSTGAEHVGGYGVIIKNDSTDDSFTQYTLKKTVTNILSTGQFTYTLNNKYGASAGEELAGKPKNFTAPIAFRGFVTYDVSYTAAGKTTNINVSEYSNGDHDANA